VDVSVSYLFEIVEANAKPNIGDYLHVYNMCCAVLCCAGLLFACLALPYLRTSAGFRRSVPVTSRCVHPTLFTTGASDLLHIFVKLFWNKLNSIIQYRQHKHSLWPSLHAYVSTTYDRLRTEFPMILEKFPNYTEYE
jgi:hypothetical protein